MMTASTVEVHHLFEGPEEAPVLVLWNSGHDARDVG
jgi:hypothetical protein